MLSEAEKAEIRSEFRGADNSPRESVWAFCFGDLVPDFLRKPQNAWGCRNLRSFAVSARKSRRSRRSKTSSVQAKPGQRLHACRPEEVRAALENTDPPHKPAPEKKEYSAEFKAQAVEEVRAGRTVKSVAGQYGIAANTLKSWMVKARTQKKEPVQAEPQPSQAKPKLSGNTAYSIQMLLNSEVNRWMDKLAKELVEGGEAQPGTLGNLRAVLLARDEFYRFTLPGKGVETDEKAEMDP